jgi:hypothetical protein
MPVWSEKCCEILVQKTLLFDKKKVLKLIDFVDIHFLDPQSIPSHRIVSGTLLATYQKQTSERILQG